MSDHDDLIAVARRWENLYAEERLVCQGWERLALRKDAQIAALKAALAELVKATHVLPDGHSAKTARERAIAVLGSPTATSAGENLRDGSMRQPGGVSDGPQ